MKEAEAVALFPGGFGTLDEAMETLTLVQAGKNAPIPLILIDDDDGSYWEPWLDFIKQVLLKRGVISGEDFSLFTITRDPFEAAQVIDDFYRNYHSSRWVGPTYVIRLNKPLSAENLAVLEEEFSEIIEPGSRLQMTTALPEEQDQPDLVDLPRLVFQFNRRSYGLLKAFLRRLNSFAERRSAVDRPDIIIGVACLVFPCRRKPGCNFFFCGYNKTLFLSYRNCWYFHIWLLAATSILA